MGTRKKTIEAQLCKYLAIKSLQQDMFKDIDKEADGEIYYREMVTYLKSLDRDMDQQSNPLVSLVPYLKILVLNTLMRFFFKAKAWLFF